MLIGHINLAETIQESGEPFIRLVEAIARARMEQYILVRNENLAKRLAVIDNVTVGSIVHSPVMAYCLLPRVDIAHAHNVTAGQAGLLLTLTRSIPYVLTHRGTIAPNGNPLIPSVYKRATRILCQDDSEVAVLRHWLPGLAAEVVPDIDRDASAARHLRIYQNSQSMPIAGNSGIQ